MSEVVVQEVGGQVASKAAEIIAENFTEQAAQNTTTTVQQAVVQQSSALPGSGVMWWNTWYFVFAFALVIIALFALIYLILKMDHDRRMAQPKESRNVVLLIVISGFALLALLMIAEFVGILPRGWLAKNGRWVIPLIIISMFGFAMYALVRGRIKSMEQALYRALQVGDDLYGARDITGREEGYTVNCYKRSFEPDDKGNKMPVGTFFLWIRNYSKFMLIIQLSLRDLSVNYLYIDPPVEFVRKELSKKIGVVADAYIEAKSKYEEEAAINQKEDVNGQNAT